MSVGGDGEIAVKPVAIGLFRPEEIELARHRLDARPGQGRSEKQIIELVWGNDDLNRVLRYLFGRKSVDEQLSRNPGFAKTGADQFGDLADEEIRF